MQNMS
jgi:hypothetical protein